MGKTGGGFESFKLRYPLFKAIKVKGYKVPTPIQRRAIPPLLAGNDVIATARTGSGKTAAFLIPIVQKLEEHSQTVGVRAVIVSPTRELAIQTCRFAAEFTKFTSLRTALITGGEGLKMEFQKLAENPDILIATPGRLMHLITELSFSLASVQIVVLDEGDRLVEMGLWEQVQAILKSMSLERRQTVLISASMPAQLADYAKTGLTNPVLVKLDQERSIPDTLTLKFYYLRKESKEAMLLYLLRGVINAPDSLTIVFVATKHHVEFYDTILRASGISCAGLYGELDQQVRETTMDAFRKKQLNVLIVTDLAARGIDIPLLDYTVQVDFAANPRLFINRVGRVARAGKTGTSFSFVCKDELPYYYDTLLHLAKQEGSDFEPLGLVPEPLIQVAFEELALIHREKVSADEVYFKRKSMDSAMKLYNKTRPSASAESVRKAKSAELKVHPDFNDQAVKADVADITEQIREYRPDMTILEVNAALKGDRERAEEMKRKRMLIGQKKTRKVEEEEKKEEEENEEEEVDVQVSDFLPTKRSSESCVPLPTKRRRGQCSSFRDPSSYMSTESTHFFDKDTDLMQLSMSMPQEDELGFKLDKRRTKWDKRKKKYIRQDEETSVLAKMKKNNRATAMYKQWKTMTKKRIQRPGEVEDERMRHSDIAPQGEQQGRSEIKTRDQLLKQRKKQERMQNIRKRQEMTKRRDKHRKG